MASARKPVTSIASRAGAAGDYRSRPARRAAESARTARARQRSGEGYRAARSTRRALEAQPLGARKKLLDELGVRAGAADPGRCRKHSSLRSEEDLDRFRDFFRRPVPRRTSLRDFLLGSLFGSG